MSPVLLPLSACRRAMPSLINSHSWSISVLLRRCSLLRANEADVAVAIAASKKLDMAICAGDVVSPYSSVNMPSAQVASMQESAVPVNAMESTVFRMPCHAFMFCIENPVVI